MDEIMDGLKAPQGIASCDYDGKPLLIGVVGGVLPGVIVKPNNHQRLVTKQAMEDEKISNQELCICRQLRSLQMVQ